MAQRPSHRYSLRFVGPAIDEELLLKRLRELGASHLEIEACAIERPEREVRLTQAEQVVMDLLSDLQAHRRKAIKASLAGICPPSQTSRVIQGLEDVELIRKVRHGVYCHASAPRQLEIPPADNNVPRRTYKQVLELLEEAHSVRDLAAKLGVTRQRADQIVKTLEARGEIAQTRSEGRPNVYHLPGNKPPSAPPKLSPSKARLLSALKADRLVTLRGLADHLQTVQQAVSPQATDLERRGLLSLYKLGHARYAAITPLGLAHPQRLAEAPGAPGADVYEGFGRVRAAFMQVLHVAGPLRTIDLTYAVPPDLLEGEKRTSGQFVQDLERERLVRPVDPGTGHSRYALTPRGTLAAHMIGLAHPPPNLADLEASMQRRHAARVELLRSRSTREGLSPLQASAMEALRKHGPMRRGEIYQRMPEPRGSAGSLHVTLQTLAANGHVRRVLGPGRSVTWTANDGNSAS